MSIRSQGSLRDLQIYPILHDRTTSQTSHGYYFYQDTWGARRAFHTAPETIVDVGSSVLLVGILAQFRPVTSVDIRPIDASLPGLVSRSGSICELPFPDRSVEYIQSLCVIEHIGLGRYGDPLDSAGSERAIAEVKRVVRPGGSFVFSVPVGPPCIAFNAHRVFSEQHVLSWFEDGWSVVDRLDIPAAHGRGSNPRPMRKGDFVVTCLHVRREPAGTEPDVGREPAGTEPDVRREPAGTEPALSSSFNA